MKTSAKFVTLTLATSLAVLSACEDKKQTTPPVKAPAAAKHDDHGHDQGHGGAVIDLGTATVGQFSVKATRDDGQIVAGKDAPIDLTITPAAGSAAKVATVRFWIGTEDAKDSIKAKGEIEDPKDPNRWHTHAEIPSPIPSGAKLWVEVEDDKGVKATGGFDLKA